MYDKEQEPGKETRNHGIMVLVKSLCKRNRLEQFKNVCKKVPINQESKQARKEANDYKTKYAGKLEVTGQETMLENPKQKTNKKFGGKYARKAGTNQALMCAR